MSRHLNCLELVGYNKKNCDNTFRLSNAVVLQCTELFDLLGVPWVRAAGEAEATCAALNYHKVSDSLGHCHCSLVTVCTY